MREFLDKDTNGYLPVYRSLAAYLGPAARVVELGVYRGASLTLWQDLFPDTDTVVGVDNDPNAIWPIGTVRVVCDQADDELVGLLLHISSFFDLVVDDASHDGTKTMRSFELFWPLVRPGGFYVIEDWIIGFPSHEAYATHGSSMLTLARGLLDRLEHMLSDVRTISYSHGLIIVQKKWTNEMPRDWAPWHTTEAMLRSRPRIERGMTPGFEPGMMRR